MSISWLTPSVFSPNKDRFMARCFRSVTLLCETGGGGRGMSDWSLVGYEQSTASHHKNKPQRIHSSLKKIRKLARSSLSPASSVKCYPLHTSATSSAEMKWNHFHVHCSQVHIYVILITSTVILIFMIKSLCCVRLRNERKKLEEDGQATKEARRQTNTWKIPQSPFFYNFNYNLEYCTFHYNFF